MLDAAKPSTRHHGTMTNHIRGLAALGLLSSGVLLVGCGNDVGGESASSTTATPTSVESAASSTVVVVTSIVTVPATAAPAPTVATVPTSTPSPTTGSALDWDGVRYDFGRITRLSSNENEDLITFDRYQLYGDDGELQSAPDFTEEPIVVGNSDLPWVNDNLKERTYVIDPEAEVLTLANLGEIQCGGNDRTEQPAWQSGTVDDLFAAGTPESEQVSLMFSDEGQVTLIRVSESC